MKIIEFRTFALVAKMQRVARAKVETSFVSVLTKEDIVRVQTAQTVEAEAEDEKYYRPDTQAIYFNEPPEGAQPEKIA